MPVIDPLLLEAMREVDAMLPGTTPIAPSADLARGKPFVPPWCWLDPQTLMVHNHRDYSIKPLAFYEVKRRW